MSGETVELLRQLTSLHGVSGHEEAVREFLKKRLAGVGAVTQDRMGNLFCKKEGSCGDPVVMVDCHLDEVGFVVQSITRGGFVRFAPLGGWWSHTLLSQRVDIVTEKQVLPGVIGGTPPHLLSESRRKTVLPLEELYIDIGAESEEEAKAWGIQPGQPIVPATAFRRFANPNILSAKAFDNRVGTALLIEGLEQLESHPNCIYGVGCVQEEVGVRGATVAVRSVHPDVALVLEGAPADDTPGLERESGQGKLGRGVQIRLFDPTMIAHPRFAQWLIGLAEQHAIAHQVAVRRFGGTDGRAIHLHDRGVPTVVLGVPARYIHSHVSLISLDDYSAALQLLKIALAKLDRALVRSFF